MGPKLGLRETSCETLMGRCQLVIERLVRVNTLYTTILVHTLYVVQYLGKNSLPLGCGRRSGCPRGWVPAHPPRHPIPAPTHLVEEEYAYPDRRKGELALVHRRHK